MLCIMAITKILFKQSTRLIAVSVAVVIMWMSIQSGSVPSVLTRIEYLLYDLRFNLLLDYTKRDQSDHKIAIIDIDEDAIVEIGRFPWSRHKVATLIDKLGEAGVLVTAFDVVFSEAEENPVDYIAGLAPDAL